VQLFELIETFPVVFCPQFMLHFALLVLNNKISKRDSYQILFVFFQTFLFFKKVKLNETETEG
jgi:hypothetical protein